MDYRANSARSKHILMRQFISDCQALLCHFLVAMSTTALMRLPWWQLLVTKPLALYCRKRFTFGYQIWWWNFWLSKSSCYLLTMATQSKMNLGHFVTKLTTELHTIQEHDRVDDNTVLLYLLQRPFSTLAIRNPRVHLDSGYTTRTDRKYTDRLHDT